MEPNPEFTSNFLGSSVANLVFTILFGIGAWIKGRLNASNCKCDCGFFECNTSLIELQKVRDEMISHQETQRTILKDIHKLQKEIKHGSMSGTD